MPDHLWVIVDYGLPGGWYGLHVRDRVCGIPEGTLQDWRELLAGIRNAAQEEVCVQKRLAWSADQGVYSPRNSNDKADFKIDDQAALADRIERLLNEPEKWDDSWFDRFDVK